MPGSRPRPERWSRGDLRRRCRRALRSPRAAGHGPPGPSARCAAPEHAPGSRAHRPGSAGARRRCPVPSSARRSCPPAATARGPIRCWAFAAAGCRPAARWAGRARRCGARPRPATSRARAAGARVWRSASLRRGPGWPEGPQVRRGGVAAAFAASRGCSAPSAGRQRRAVLGLSDTVPDGAAGSNTAPRRSVPPRWRSPSDMSSANEDPGAGADAPSGRT